MAFLTQGLPSLGVFRVVVTRILGIGIEKALKLLIPFSVCTALVDEALATQVDTRLCAMESRTANGLSIASKAARAEVLGGTSAVLRFAIEEIREELRQALQQVWSHSNDRLCNGMSILGSGQRLEECRHAITELCHLSPSDKVLERWHHWLRFLHAIQVGLDAVEEREQSLSLLRTKLVQLLLLPV
jgi:hypothetical protein